MKRIVEIISQSKRIFQKDHLSITQRINLWYSFLGLVLKRFLLGRIPGIDESTAKFLGYYVKVGKFGDFYWTFMEVFIEEDYMFSTETSQPSIIDCGGNIGISTLYFKWLYPDSVVTVFEPESHNIELIRYNIQKNNLSNVNLVEVAVGAEEGELMLSGSGRASTIRPDRTSVDISENNQKVVVKVLSGYIDGTVDFLKMDIEGAEDDVINELIDSKKIRMITALTFEYHRRENESPSRFINLCDSLEKSGLQIVPLKETLYPERITHIMVKCLRKDN